MPISAEDGGGPRADAPRRREPLGLASAIGNVLLVGLGIVLAALLLEVFLRVANLPPHGVYCQHFNAERFRLYCFESSSSMRCDSDLRDATRRKEYEARFADGEFARHWSDTPCAVEVHFNSDGYREREFGPPHGERIVIVGDSFTMGYGLPNADSYPRRLEALLAERDPGHDREVLNLGRAGANLNAIARNAKSALQDLRPDVLVYGYFLNDPSWRGGIRAMQPPRRYEATGSRSSMAYPWLKPLRLLSVIQQVLENPRISARTVDSYRRLHERDYWRPSGELILRMAAQARRQNVRFVLIVLPLIFELDDYPLADVHSGLAEFAKQNGIELHDVLPRLRGYRDEDLYLHPLDRHPNGTYTRVVAEALVDTILSDRTVRAPGE